MFLFNISKKKFDEDRKRFKYNFCFSSTMLPTSSLFLHTNLNTTFVSLQRLSEKTEDAKKENLNTTFVSLQQALENKNKRPT